jgi:hypothetical protein
MEGNKSPTPIYKYLTFNEGGAVERLTTPIPFKQGAITSRPIFPRGKMCQMSKIL